MRWFVRSRFDRRFAIARGSAASINEKGFTQAELIVTILIIGILAAIAAPNLSRWLSQKQVDAALNEIDFALQETQTEAVKRDRTCQLNILRGTEPPLTGSCLVTGNRVLKGIVLNHSRGPDLWTISFNERGENRTVSNDPGTLRVSSTNGNVRVKCLVISVGIGLRRIGKYENGKCTKQ
jgi:prepilin-type N-terminal cleavage/methylation domain-containing protein